MSTDLTPVDEFTTTIPVPEDGDGMNSNSVNVAFQALANRTEYNSKRSGALTVVKSADETKASDNTPGDDSELLVALEASSTYRFRALLFIDNDGATAGFRAQMDCTVAVTSIKYSGKIFDVSTDGVFPAHRSVLQGQFSATGGEIGTTETFAEIEGTVETSGAGTLSVQWAQNTADASDTTVQRNSFLEAVKV